MAKRHTRHRKRQRQRQRNRTMKGGALSVEQIQQLEQRGFDIYIVRIQELNVPFDEIIELYNILLSDFEGNIDGLAQQVMDEIEHRYGQNNSNIPDLNSQTFNLDDSFESHGSLHESDLDMNESIMSGYTTGPDETGGKRRRRKSIRKGKKNRKTKKNRRQKGGCFGRGVGANNYDPNYSIYNTNMLKLFPYKTF
jgi:hypothetical protein